AVHASWLWHAPRSMSRASPELIDDPPGARSRRPPSHVHGYPENSTVWQRTHVWLMSDAGVGDGAATPSSVLVGTSDGFTSGSSTCCRDPRWHASQPMPTSTRSLPSKRR